jgi:hypothetical protein
MTNTAAGEPATKFALSLAHSELNREQLALTVLADQARERI